MSKFKKLFIIGCLLMVMVNVGFATMQRLADNIPTVQAEHADGHEEGTPVDADGDGLDDFTDEPVGDGDSDAEETDEDEPQIASPDEIADTLSQGARSLLLRFSDLLAVILQMLNYLLWPILMMIGALMDNSIIFGGGMEDRLLQIWSQIRNIVNLLFVVILVGMALYNVLGIGEEGNYTIKKILPKFIIALIVVNFTFTGAKVILDAANVATNAVFALPNTVEEEFNLTRIDQLEQAVCGTLDDLGAYGNSISLQGEGSASMCADDSTFTANARQFFQRLSSNNIALVMAVNLGQIHEGIKVSELVRQDPTVSNLTINILFSILIYIVYAISFLALFFVLLVRVVVLWFVIALSPFVAVAIVLPDLVNGGGGNFNIKDIFVKHVTAPIVIGFGMTVGYLMLDAYHATTGNALGIQLGEQFANGFSGMSSLQQLLIGIGAIAIVWVVTFQAAQGTMADAITRNIKSFAQRAGSNIAKLPLTIPIIPVPDNLNDGPVGLGNVISTVGTQLSDFNREGFQPIGSNLNRGNGGGSDANNRIQDFTNLGEIERLAPTAPLNRQLGAATTALSYFGTNEFNNLNVRQARSYFEGAYRRDNSLDQAQYDRIIEQLNGLDENETMRNVNDGIKHNIEQILIHDAGIQQRNRGDVGQQAALDTDGDNLIEQSEVEAAAEENEDEGTT